VLYESVVYCVCSYCALCRQSDTAMCCRFCEDGLVHVWWGFVAESGRHAVWYMCAAELCEGSLVCVWLPFLAKCSCKFDSTVLSFMSVCVWGCAPKFSIHSVVIRTGSTKIVQDFDGCLYLSNWEIWRPNLDQEKVQSKCYHMASILATPLNHVRDHTPVYDHSLMSYLPKSRRFLAAWELLFSV